jgi:rubrerythrin
MPEAPDSFDRIVEQCILMEIQAMSLYTTLANRVEDEEQWKRIQKSFREKR